MRRHETAGANLRGRRWPPNTFATHMHEAQTVTPPAAPGDPSAIATDAMAPRPRRERFLRLLPRRCVVTTGPRDGNALYLTFDDGPHPEHTPPLLDLLARHGAKATFFLIGANAERHAAIARRIVEDGHVLGNHSWDHPHFDRLGRVARREQVQRTEALLQSIDGQAAHDFRPPRGVATPGVLVDGALGGTRLAYWSYDSLDYSQRAPQALLANMAANPVRAGDVVLMHDDSAHSRVMLETLLPEWRRQGHTLQALRPPGAGARAGASP